MKWFTSDTHFKHINILRHDGRPFSSIEEHDEALINNWNAVVLPGDVVYHLGDFGWMRTTQETNLYLARLHGVKFLIRGNHDHAPIRKASGWTKVVPYLEIAERGQKIVLFHYRMVVWNASHHGSWALHGHSHGSLPVNYRAKTMDVGTMLHGFRPISFDEVAEEMQKHVWVPVDAHGKGQE